MSTENSPPLKPISSNDMPWTEWSVVPRFGVRYRHLTSAALGKHYRVGVAIEELPPGNQTAPAHYHIFEEEHVYILEGALTARIGAEAHEMRAGDYVCFPAGQKAGHCLINNSGAVCRYVLVGERNMNDVVVYTDSRKVLVRAVGQRALLDLAATRGYWDGENTGLPAGTVAPVEFEGVVDAIEAGKPNPPIPSRDAASEEVREGTRFGGRRTHLTHAAVGADYHVGVVIEAPVPGMRLAPRHYHMLEEEQALILDGQVTLLLGDERYEMRAGDYVCFPAGRKVAHSFMNSGTGPCRYLMIGEGNPNDVCVYPDSNKVAVNALRTKTDDPIFDMAATRTYWDGEQTS